MNPKNRKRAIFAVISVLLLAALACGGNSGGNTGGDEPQVDLAGTQAALEATQAALEAPVEVEPEPTSPPPPPPTADAGGGETGGGEVDYSNLQSGDVIFASDFDGDGSDWEEGWIHFHITSLDGDPDNYGAIIDGGFLTITVDQRDTTVYALYDELYLPRDAADVLVEAAYNNRGVRSNNVSIVCRGSGDGWYEFSLGSDGLWYIWMFTSGDGYTRLANGGLAGYNKNDTDHVLSATCIGDELTFFIDGTMPKGGQVHDATYREGQVAVSVSTLNLVGAEVEFDWFQVSVP